jgi:hypothetical protein
MCHSYFKHCFFTLVILFTGFSSFSQNSNKENAPYSRYGIGELRNGVNAALKGMGSVSSAYFNQYNINTDNPASYAHLKFTTYEAGAEGNLRTIIANKKSYGTGSATISYLTLGIPLGKHAGMAVGLRPFSRVFYRMTDTASDIPGMGPTVRNFSGDGATTVGFIGAGGTYKGFSIGANVGYLFGTIRNTTLLQKVYDTVNAYNSDFSKYTKIGGLHWKLGLQYSTNLKKNLQLRLGGTISTSTKVSEHIDNYGIAWRIGGGTTIADTAVQEQVNGKMTLPLSYSLGIQLAGNEQWMAGIDFSASQWSQFRNLEMKDSIDNSFRIGLGGEYTPDAANLYHYFQRITYRLGFYYGRDYVNLRNTDLNYYALSAGLSLPFKKSTDRLHLAMEIGKRGTETNGLVRENFFKFSLGVSLNDKWFVKRKYE